MKKIILFAMISGLAGYLHAQNFVWAKQMAGANTEGRSITLDATGNVYTTGYFQGTVDFDPGPAVFNMTSFGSIDIFISKLDAAGNFLWAKQMGGTSFDEGFGIVISATGNVYTSGRFTSTADFDPGPGTFNLTGSLSGSGSAFISKLDAAGNFVWAVAFIAPTPTGTMSEARSIALDANENVYTTGTFLGSTVDFDPGAGTQNLVSIGGNDIFISKLSVAGNFVWARALNGTSLSDRAMGIAVAPGSVYITGDFKGTTDFDPGAGIFNITSFASGFTPDIFVLKLDDLGGFGWAKRLGSEAEDFGLSIAVDASGNVHTTGTFRETADFDPGAGTANLTVIGLDDVFVSKLNASGNFVWAKSFGGTLSNCAGCLGGATTIGNSIGIDAGGNVYMTGSFEGPGFPNPFGVPTFGMSSFGDLDIFVVKLNSSGSVDWARQLGGTMRDRGNSIAVNSGGDVYTTGFFRGTADFDPGTGVYNLTGDGLFISKLGSAADLDGDGYTLAQGDCNDNNAAVHPGATELCNGIDDDCDGQTDEGVQLTFYRDLDVDGYGNAAVTTQACSVPAGYVANSTDCNDNNSAVHPGATELCNGIDDDCDGQVDEGVQLTFYRDLDVDGYGNAAVTTLACTAPAGYVANNTDCNDNNAAVHPGATELCNGTDDDCDGQVDEGVRLTFYRDLDGDGYGNAAVTTQACSAPAGYVTNNTDCNDNSAAVHPGATELCNGMDDDCDGQVDEGVRLTFYRDQDGDGYGNAAVTTQACSAPAGYVANNTDCNDNNAAVHPGATELCTNSIDDDCDGLINEGCPATAPSISIADVTVLESAGSVLVPVTLSAPSASIILVSYITLNGTARFPRDYRLTLGFLTFLPGQVSKNISIPIVADAVPESSEYFNVLLLLPFNATINDGTSRITINEALPTVSIKNNPITEATAAEELRLYVPNPQPKHEHLRFFGLQTGTFDVILTDINGNTVANLKNYRNNWSPGRLTPGVYFYRVIYRNKEAVLLTKTGKLLITD